MANASWVAPLFVNRGDFTAVASTASETSLLAGSNVQPVIPAFYFDQENRGVGKTLRVVAGGVLGTTGTPTITFKGYLATTAGSSTLTGSSIAVSSAITTSSGVSNKWWWLELNLTCSITGLGTGNCTVFGAGSVRSPGGFASPFEYPLEISAPDTATWTTTFDASLTQYIQLSATWSASSSSNTITCKYLKVFGEN